MSTFVSAPKKGFRMIDKVVESEPVFKPKRFVLFAGSTYYPSGGWDDYAGSADTLQDALEVGEKIDEDWWHVVDLETGEVHP